MHGTSYLDTRRRHPGLLAAAVVLHIGIVGVILSYHPEILPGRPDAIGLIPISKELPPPLRPTAKPVREKLNPDPRPKLDPRITTIPLEPLRPQWPEFPPLPPGDPLGGPGGAGGSGGTTVPDPVLTPVGIDGRYAGYLQPPYPLTLQRAEIEGNVVVRVQVGIDGRVAAIELIRADDPAFFAATRDWALKRWRFKPATRDGVPVVTWITKTVRFQIER